MEIALTLVLFIFLVTLSYFVMNSSFIDNKYNPFKIQVAAKNVLVVDRFGSTRILEEGFQNFFPFIDEIEHTVSLKEETIYPEQLEIFTLDNQQIKLDYHIVYKVIEPIKALNNVYDYKNTLKRLVTISTLNVMSNTLLDEVSATTIQKIRDDIEKESKNWGIEISRILFDNISL